MKDQPLASIGVPVYNGGKYLEECLQSILDQTYTNWECVIVDNRSTDDTNEIARRFTEKDERFRLVENEEFVGQTENWNISFRKIDPDSKYFKIVPADDWIFPEYLVRMVEVMEKHPSTGICSSYRLDDTKVNCDFLDYYDGEFHSGKKILNRELLENVDLTGSINTVLYRIDALKKVPEYPALFKEGVYHIDTILAHEVQYLSDQGFVFQVLSYTRRHNETYTSQITFRFRTTLYLRERELSYYLDLDQRLKEEYRKIRISYVYFLFLKRLKGDRECIKWHKKYLDPSRRITWVETVKVLLLKVYYKITLRRM